MEYLLGVFILLGFNFTFWFGISALRFLDDVLFRKDPVKYFDISRQKKEQKWFIKPKQVVAIVPAYNEELVIADTIKSLLVLLPRKNIFVNTYGSVDRTAEIASGFQVNVLNEATDGKTKAEKLSSTVKRLAQDKKFKAVLFVDADTRISRDFLVRGLPYFSDPKVVAFAGYATTLWSRRDRPYWGMFYISYRERVYFFMQIIVKYAQTWRNTNVSPIVPGFASIYRMSILPQIEIDPKGLVIEDFNMTFEVHHKKLGKIAHHPSVFAKTQDPDNFRDYVRQVSRWDLGFWQTVRRHGFWASTFSVSLILYIVDILFGSIVFLLLPLVFFMSFVPLLVPAVLHFEWFLAGYNFIYSHFNVKVIFISIFVIDYTLTIIVAFVQKRVDYFLFGFGYLFLRYVDSLLYIIALPRAYFVKSTGRWKSPERR